MINKRKIGADYEETACKYLKQQDYTIIERNFRCKIGEIDIIAKNDSYLVFLEVKYRKNSKMGFPIEAVDRKKTI